jgi:3-deoxy-D-arabino-heptulosonate 7-phosphate (DAHP) synthase
VLEINMIERKIETILGPCSVHSYPQLKETADALNHGVIPNLKSIRANIVKPRSGDEWTGLGKSGINIIKQVKEETGCRISMEVTTVRNLEYMLEVADDLWLGAKQQPNNTLEIADALRGVKLGMFAIKNRVHPDAKSWIGAINVMEKRLHPDIKRVALFRGFFEIDHVSGALDWRNNPRINIVQKVVEETGITPWIDFSHLIGDTNLILDYTLNHRLHPIFQGAMLEIDARPSEALTDKKQVLTPQQGIAIVNHWREDSPNFQIGII